MPDKIKENANTVREILDKLYRKAGDFTTSNMTDDIDQALSAIKQWALENLPEEKELLIRSGRPKNSRYNKMILGFNECLQEIRKRLEKI